MTQSLHSLSVPMNQLKRSIVVGTLIATVLMVMPVSASAHTDPAQAPVPGHTIGRANCAGTMGGYTNTRVISVEFPYQIMGRSTSPEYVYWQPILWKYNASGWTQVDNSAGWSAAITDSSQGIYNAFSHYSMWNVPVGATFQRNPSDANDIGYYVVRNWFYWPSIGRLHYEDSLVCFLD